MSIICIERILVAVTDLDAACERWRKAGFALAQDRPAIGGIRFARFSAAAVAIDLCAADPGANPPECMKEALARGGAVIGWTWGTAETGAGPYPRSVSLPSFEGSAAQETAFTNFLPGVWTGALATDPDPAKRRRRLLESCGANENTVDCLEHVVVMTPSLDDAIAAHEKIGLVCKRIREAGGGMRQAFFKLEQTVLEIVGPARGTPQVWGLAFLCRDIARAVQTARANGLQATEPKTAIQGGRIARIVDALDGVAVAFMEPANQA